MSELDNARAGLQPFMFVVGFVDAIERFEAAVRANERSGATTAAILREQADELEQAADEHEDTYVPQGLYDAADRLRRKADEALPGTRCDVEFVGGGTCSKPAGHRTRQGHDPHTPSRAQQGAELPRCTCDYIAESWISMQHAPGCPVRPREQQP